MAREHIVRSYDEELDLMKAKLVEMGEEAGRQLSKALEALNRHDHRLAEQVINRDNRVNALQNDVDNLVVGMLAMRQPMALDLRHIISGLRIAAELERIADYAANIAKYIIDIDHVYLEQPVARIIRMASVAKDMLDDIIAAYQKTDVNKAVAVWHQDEDINQIYVALLSQLRSYMQVDSENIKTYTSLIFVARCCERIGDHIKNVAESIYFIEHGKNYAEAPMSQ